MVRLATLTCRSDPLAAAAPARWKLYSFHAPEVECIGRGKASAPYEFGVKASVVTTNARAPGGQFVLHARTLPGVCSGHLIDEGQRPSHFLRCDQQHDRGYEHQTQQTE